MGGSPFTRGGGQQQREAHVSAGVAAAPAPVSHIDPHELERKRRLANEAFRAAEDVIFQEGYRKGQSSTLARIDEEAEVRARGVFGRLQQEAEEELAARTKAETEAVRARLSSAAVKRSAASGSSDADRACRAEEEALLQCDPRTDSSGCGAAQATYVRCAEAALHRAMNPRLG